MIDFVAKAVRMLVKDRPVMTIIVYDEQLLTFSRPHPVRTKRVVARQGWTLAPVTRARKVLKPKDDTVTVITEAILFHSELRDGVGREYVLVKGHHFSFGGRLGRDFFDPKTDDLRAKFGEPDGQYIEAMIEHHFPQLFKKTA
jgi:hypothetical protein